jgi:hypothetical protein
MAEREGFEPPIPVKVCLISSQVHSTGLCHLSTCKPLIANGFCGVMSGRSIIPKVTIRLLQEATFRPALHPKSRRIPTNPMLKLSRSVPGHDFPVLWDFDTLTSEICTTCPCHLTVSVIRMEKSP